MRPSFKAVCEIERTTGVSVAALAKRFLQGDVKISELAAIVTAGLREAGEPATYEKVGELVFEAGMDNVLLQVLDYLGANLTREKDGTEDAAEGT